MLQPIVSLLALIAVLLHASVGCCAHHGGCGVHAVSHAEAEQDGHHHVDEGAAGTREHSHSPVATAADETAHASERVSRCAGPCQPDGHPHDDCHEGHCKYVSANTLKVPAPDESAPILDSLPTADQFLVRSIAGASGDCRQAASLLAYAPDLGIRSLTQTWLL